MPKISAKKPAIMVQGTGSNVGKSVLVAGLARVFARQGLNVRPFKPQNMSNNAAVTPDGGEIGRAQALQALAAGISASVHMNPVLLKPETERGAQVIVQGRCYGTFSAQDYQGEKTRLLPQVLDSFLRLEEEADLILVEGAGSPAEVNLRSCDIANMGFAEAADLPVLLLGDIDRGGVIASLCGTHMLLPETERARIKGFAINKFRGDPNLFNGGILRICQETGWPTLGTVPWFSGASVLPAEDAQDLTFIHPLASSPSSRKTSNTHVTIAVPLFSRIANFDDLDPLRTAPGVDVIMVPEGQAIPAPVDLVILPGTKSTFADLQMLRREGWDIDLKAHIRRGGFVLGICGGYQMLGRKIFDPHGLESTKGSAEGLGYLDVSTTLHRQKTTIPITAQHLSTGLEVRGYEIHMGLSTGADCARPLFEIRENKKTVRSDGACSPCGKIMGSYVHGMFAQDAFRQAFLAQLCPNKSSVGHFSYSQIVEDSLDALATHLETHLDISRIYEIAASRASGQDAVNIIAK